MFNLNGQVAVVTGASAGLGVQFANALARQGATIVLLARRQEKMAEVAEELRRNYGVQVLTLSVDVTDTQAVDEAVERVLTAFGRVDILVNNAGGSKGGPIESLDDESWQYGMDLSLNSTFKCTRAFGRAMLQAGYGRIINIASILGLGGSPEIQFSPYNTAKGGVVNFTKTAAAEWATRGVTVNAIAPGFFASESNTPEALEAMEDFIIKNTPMRRVGLPGELDSAIVFLAAKESSYVTGAIISVDGGWTAI